MCLSFVFINLLSFYYLPTSRLHKLFFFPFVCHFSGAFVWITSSVSSLILDKLWKQLQSTKSGTVALDLTVGVKNISWKWLPDGQWFALIPAMGGQAASVKTRATLPMVAPKAAILTYPTLDPKTGRGPCLNALHTHKLSINPCLKSIRHT